MTIRSWELKGYELSNGNKISHGWVKEQQNNTFVTPRLVGKCLPYAVILITFLTHKWHQSMLTTSLQRTLITFPWFSHNKALTATEDMSFNLLRQITVLRINILTDGYTVPWNYAVNTKTSMSDTCRSPPRWGVFKRPKLLMWLIFQYWRLVAVSTKTHLLCEETWSLKYLMAIKYNILGNWVASDLHQHVPEEVKINIRFYNLTYPTTWILKWNNILKFWAPSIFINNIMIQ